jgi:O-antigen/teichoic acid export membrane protein
MKIKANIAANFLGNAWSSFLGVAFVPVYIRYLGMEAYSLVGVYAILQTWLSMFDLGMTPTLNREMALFNSGEHTRESIGDLLRSLEMIAIGVMIFIAASVYFGSGFIAQHWLKVDSLSLSLVAQALSVSGVVVGLRFVEGIYRSSLFGLEKQLWYNSANSILMGLRWIGVIGVLHYYSNSIFAFFAWQGIVSVFAVIAFSRKTYTVIGKATRSFCFSKEALQKVSSFAGGLFGITFLALLLTQVDKIILSKMLTLKEFGYYSLATNVSSAIFIVTIPITQAIYPRMVDFISKKKVSSLIETYHLSAQLISSITASILMVFVFYSYDMLYLWTKNSEISINASRFLVPLSIGSFLNATVWMPYQLQMAYGQAKFSLKANAVAVVFLIPAIILAVPFFGAIGAAWVWVALNLGYVFISVPLMHRFLLQGEKWHWYVCDLLLPVSAGLIVIQILKLFFKPEFFEQKILGLLWLGASFLICLLASVFFSNGLRPKVFDFIRRLF